MISHRESEKYKKLVNIKKGSRLTDIENKLQLSVVGEGNNGEGAWEVQALMYKSSCKDILHNIGNGAI